MCELCHIYWSYSVKVVRLRHFNCLGELKSVINTDLYVDIDSFT